MTRRTFALLATATLLVGGCADDDISPPATLPTSPTSTSTVSSSPTETMFAGTEIEVTVVAGKVTPPTHRVKITQGTPVRLLVTSDVDEELHVHGYDIRQDLPAGQQATLDFTADQTGVFEVETEKNGLQLVQLEVR